MTKDAYNVGLIGCGTISDAYIRGLQAFPWLELDLGWCRQGGVDPLPLITKYSGRVPRVHVKDRAPEGENTNQGGWADVGYGVIDWPPLLEATKDAGTQWFVVKYNEPENPVRTIKRNFDTLEAL